MIHNEQMIYLKYEVPLPLYCSKKMCCCLSEQNQISHPKSITRNCYLH